MRVVRPFDTSVYIKCKWCEANLEVALDDIEAEINPERTNVVCFFFYCGACDHKEYVYGEITAYMKEQAARRYNVEERWTKLEKTVDDVVRKQSEERLWLK